MPPEGLGTVLAPTGPFLRPCRIKPAALTLSIMNYRSLGAIVLLIAGCAKSKPTVQSDVPSSPSPVAETNPAANVQRTSSSSAPEPASSRPTPAATAPASRLVKPFEGITVDVEKHEVFVRAWVCLEGGYLEQVACGVGSREHESLMVIKAKASQVHAALLLAGFQPGSPGKWTYENRTIGTIAPTGDQLDVLVKYRDPRESGRETEKPIREWIQDANSDRKFPPNPWTFGGSAIMPNEEFMGPGEHYVADMSGSIIGLVTFGDEVVGYSEVISDQDAVQAPEWELNTNVVPPMGTEVTLILRRHVPSP